MPCSPWQVVHSAGTAAVSFAVGVYITFFDLIFSEAVRLLNGLG